MTSNRERAEKLAGPHIECDDPWYACALSKQGMLYRTERKCTCGRNCQADLIEKALDAVRNEAIEDLCCRIEAAKVSAKAKRKRGKLDGLEIRWVLSDLAQQLRSLRSGGG